MEIGWIHFSEKEKKAAYELAKKFDDDESNDPLGLGAVISTFSNHFFPGIVSGQTHARYYMFGLYLLKMMKEDENFINGFGKFKEIERSIIGKLLKNEEKTTGIIGSKKYNDNNNFSLDYWMTPTERHWTGIKTFFLKKDYSLKDNINEIELPKNKDFNEEFETFKKALDKEKPLSIKCSQKEKTFIINAILGTGKEDNLLKKLINNCVNEKEPLPELFDDINNDYDSWLPAAKELSTIINCMNEYMNAIINDTIDEDELNKKPLTIKNLKKLNNISSKDSDFITQFATKPKQREDLVRKRIEGKFFPNKNTNKAKNTAMNRSGEFRYGIVKNILKDLY